MHNNIIRPTERSKRNMEGVRVRTLHTYCILCCRVWICMNLKEIELLCLSYHPFVYNMNIMKLVGLT